MNRIPDPLTPRFHATIAGTKYTSKPHEITANATVCMMTVSVRYGQCGIILSIMNVSMRLSEAKRTGNAQGSQDELAHLSSALAISGWPDGAMGGEAGGALG